MASAAFLILIASRSHGGVNRWTSTGPAGTGHVTALAVDPSDPAIVYAGTYGAGLFRSLDGAESWAPASDGLAIDFIEALLIDPGDPRTVYAATHSGVYKSTDGATSWRLVSPPLTISALAMDPDNSGLLYSATPEGILKSPDRGNSWQPAGADMPRFVDAIAIDPDNSTILYAAAFDGFFRSGDAGLSWNRVGFSGARNGFRHVAIEPTSPSTVYLTIGGEVCRSRDEANWSCSFSGLDWFKSFLFRKDGERSAIYAAGPSGVIRSVDGGATWVRTDAGMRSSGGYVNALAASSDGLLYVGTDLGVFLSRDSGNRWVSTNHGLKGAWIRTVAVDPQHPETVYSGGSAGVFKSTDGATSWAPLTTGDRQPYGPSEIAIDPVTPSTLYTAGYPNVLKSDDAGETWTTLPQAANSIALDARNPSTVYASGWDAGLSKSTNGGRSWQRTGFSLAHGVYSLLVDERRASTIYVGSGFLPDSSYPRPLGGSVFRTSDGGLTWTQSPTDLGSEVTALAADPTDSSTIYAGTAGNGFWRSTDGGSSWMRTGQGLPEAASIFSIVGDPVNAPRIYLAAGESGVYRSGDGGMTWLPLNEGLTNRNVSALTIDPGGRVLYAGTEGGGVFEMELVSSPCTPDNRRLCLLNGRFLAELSATDPRTGHSAAGVAISQEDRFGYFSLPVFTGDPTFPEVFVKMADATSSPAPFGGSFWVFYSGLTDLHYTIRIIDIVTGRERTYDGDSFCGGSDTAAFPGGGFAGSNRSAIGLGSDTLSPSGEELSLLGNRFRVALSAIDPRSRMSGRGAAIPQGDRFGYFSLPSFTGDPAFPEVFVKMAEGNSAVGGSVWFFHTGLTDLRYTLTVTDSVTGAIRTYPNNPGDPTRLCGGADTEAFSGDGLSGNWNGTIVAGKLPGVLPDEICPAQSISAVVTQTGSNVHIEFSPVCMGKLVFEGTRSSNGLSGRIMDVLPSPHGPFSAPASGDATSSSIHLQTNGNLRGEGGWFTSAVTIDLHR